jgi:hypothetical protein
MRWWRFVAAEAATTKCSGSARFCIGRLCGRASRDTSEPRAERGAKIQRAFARYRTSDCDSLSEPPKDDDNAKLAIFFVTTFPGGVSCVNISNAARSTCL